MMPNHDTTALPRYEITEADALRFWRRVERSEGCWLWVGRINADGYGYCWVGGRTRLAHRIAYQLERGPMPRGMDLDHVKAKGCSSRRCVNPDHLEPVPHIVNVRRDDTGRTNRAKTHCPKGHAYTPENVRYYRTSRSCVTCNRAAVRRHREHIEWLRSQQAVPVPATVAALARRRA